MSTLKKYFTPTTIAMAEGVYEDIYITTEESKQSIVPALLVAGIKNIGVIGWGPQGSAQAPNIRDSVAGSGVTVRVALRPHSFSRPKAEAAGFTQEDGTLGDIEEIVAMSDLVIVLVSDAAQVDIYEKIFAAMKSGATIGFSHGFLLGYLQSEGEKWPRDDVDIIGVFPKGMGDSVRRLYRQGSGINDSYAVEQDVSGFALQVAIAWATALHAPTIFKTTLEMEYRSDIFGERGVLLGGVHGLVEAVYRFLLTCEQGAPTQAFHDTVQAITGDISKMISHRGLIGAYKYLEAKYQAVFSDYYNLSYTVCRPILEEIYDEVKSGNEIRSVIMAQKRSKLILPEKINETPMWQHRKLKPQFTNDRHVALVAGMYIGLMMAQIDVLTAHGHSWSEKCNESIIEAIDSLNPYMFAHGVDFMVDNCSETARRGAKKWMSRFENALWVAMTRRITGDDHFASFIDHPVHEALAMCMKYRPPIDISVQ